MVSLFCCDAEGITQPAWREDGSFSFDKNHKSYCDIVSEVQFTPLNVSTPEQPKEEIVSKEFKIEVGKYYKDRDGEVHGPIQICDHDVYCFVSSKNNGITWTAIGEYFSGEQNGCDLIEEVPDPYEIKPEEIVKITDEVQSTEDVKTDDDNRPTIEEVLSAIQRGDEVAGIDDYESFPIRANHAIQRLLDAKSFTIKVKQPVVKYKWVYQFKSSDIPNITPEHYENTEEFLDGELADNFLFFEPIQATRKEF